MISMLKLLDVWKIQHNNAGKNIIKKNIFKTEYYFFKVLKTL